jgi:DNA-binding MarR family transcriptional regulator
VALGQLTADRDREAPVNDNHPEAPSDVQGSGVDSMPTLDLDTLALLVRAANLVRRHLDTYVLYNVHLNWTSWDVLTIINDRPGISTREIADVAVISKSGTTQVCDLLVERALIYRTRETGDRRLTQVYPTSRGSRLVTDLIPQISDAYHRYIETGRAPVGDTFRTALRELFLPPSGTTRIPMDTQ